MWFSFSLTYTTIMSACFFLVFLVDFFVHMHTRSCEDRAADVQEVNEILERHSEKAFAQGFVFQRQDSV